MPVMGKECWALCCGAIRAEFEFYATISVLCEYRARKMLDGIVVSTWKGEIDNFSGLRNKLKKLGIYTVELDQLDEDISKFVHLNYARQAYQINKGLDFIPDDVFVLKCRTDYSIDKIDLLKKFLRQNNSLILGCWGDLDFGLRYRIGVEKLNAVTPFHNGDVSYIGYKTDIRQMVQFQMKEFIFDCEYGWIDTNFYYNIFSNKFPFFDELMENTKQILFPNKNVITALIGYAKQSKEKFYLPRMLNRLYAFQYVTLYNCFALISEVHQKENIEPFHFYDVFVGHRNDMGMYAPNGSPCFGNVKCLEMIIQGKCLPSYGYSLFLTEIENLKKYGYAKALGVSSEDALEVAVWMSECLGIYPENWLKLQNKKYIYREIDKNGEDALSELCSSWKIKDEYRNDFRYIMFRTSNLHVYWKIYPYISEVIERIKEISPEWYHSTLVTLGRCYTPYNLYLIAKSLHDEQDLRVKRIVGRYKNSRDFYWGNSPSPMRLMAIYLLEKHGSTNDDFGFFEKLYSEVSKLYTISDYERKDILGNSMPEDRIRKMIQIVVEREYKNSKHDILIYNMMLFLIDCFGIEALSENVYKFLEHQCNYRKYVYPFTVGKLDALDNLIVAAKSVSSNDEGIILARTLMMELIDCNDDHKTLINNAIYLIKSKLTLKLLWLDIYCMLPKEGSVDICAADLAELDDYVLMCYVLAEANLITNNKNVLQNIFKNDLLRMCVLEYFAQKNEYDNISFLMIKSQAEIWFYSKRIATHPLNKRFIRVRNGEGILWPNGTRPSPSPFAAFMKITDGMLLLSVEFASARCLLKDIFFMVANRNNFNPIDEKENVIRLFRKHYKLDEYILIEDAVHEAINDFNMIEKDVWEAIEKMNVDAEQEKVYLERIIAKEFD